MNRRSAVLSLLSAGLHANPANGDPRLEKLFTQFTAPCCWRENLLTHHSPAADEMRAEILQKIAAGQTDDQIKASFIARYTIRILAEPEGVRALWLSSIPILASAIGIGVVALVIRNLHNPTPPVAAAHLPNIDWDWEEHPEGPK